MPCFASSGARLFVALACGRADKYDVPTLALPFHLRYRVLKQAKDAVEVHLDRPLPVSVAHRIYPEVFRRPDSMIDDCGIDSSESRDYVANQCLRRMCRTKIGLDRMAVFLPKFRNQLFCLGDCPLVIEYHLGSGGHEQSHRRRADTARTAGNQCDFAGNRQHHAIHAPSTLSEQRQKPPTLATFAAQVTFVNCGEHIGSVTFSHGNSSCLFAQAAGR
jgi:hypothetical protein